MLKETPIFENMNFIFITFQFFCGNIINVTYTHYTLQSPNMTYSVNQVYFNRWSNVGINHNQRIATLKSATELNLWQISFKLTRSLQNHDSKDTDWR